ncbi:MAG: MBL fold metallo-hydrolase [bacterium]|nr:MBL fold metallo-hydrolase [bacterium]
MNFRQMSHVTGILFFCMLLCVPSFSQHFAPKTEEVAPNLFMVSGLEGGNVAFLITDEGVVVVDSGPFPVVGRAVMEIIKKKTDKPVKTLIFTHFHSDHTCGIGGFPANIDIIAHKSTGEKITQFIASKYKSNMETRFPNVIEKLKKKIEKLKAEKSPELQKVEDELKNDLEYIKEYKTIKFIMPTITMESEKTLRMGKDEIKLVHPGNAHTNGDVIVYFKNQKVLHTGDLVFRGRHPYIDGRVGADTKNWSAFLEKISQWDIDKVVPGHGELTDKKGLLLMAGYLKDLRQTVEEGMKKNLTLEQMQKTILAATFMEGKYKDFKRPRLFKLNIATVYKELEGK